MEKINYLTAIALGSNLGNRDKNLQEAITLISQEIGKVTAVSSFHQTLAEGFISENKFLNACLICQTKLEPHALLHELKQIECLMGRKKTQATYEDRIIDLDIIFHQDHVLQTEELTIPHPLFKQRSFVLLPLMEIVKPVHPFWQLLPSE